MFGKKKMSHLQMKYMTPTLSEWIPSGYTIVEEKEGWSILDYDQEMVLQARHYEKLRDRLKTVLEAKSEIVEDSLIAFIAKKKAEA